MLELFQSALAGKSERSRHIYGKALGSFKSYIESLREKEDFNFRSCTNTRLPQILLEGWVVCMIADGLSSSTALHYIDLLSALAGNVEELRSLPFAALKKRLKDRLPEIWQCEATHADLRRFINTLKTTLTHPVPEDNIVRDMVLFSMLNRALPLARVAALRKDELEEFNDTSREILYPYIAANRKYVFPLNQSAFTPRQFEAWVEEFAFKFFKSRMLKWYGDSTTTLQTFWLMAARTRGFTPHQAMATLAVPFRPAHSPLRILNLCTPLDEACALTSTCPFSTLQAKLSSLTALFLSNPLRWFAMRLRPGVTFERLQLSLSMLGATTAAVSSPVSSIFYPSREISKRIGDRIRFRTRPVIRDIVFFRYRITDIPALFSRIGDVAWCYKSGESYAVIPDDAMNLFRSTVEAFTPEYEVAPAGSLPLKEDEEVVVVGGLFSGLEARVLQTTPGRDGTVYRLRIFGDSNDIEWRIADPSLVRKKLRRS